MDNMDTKKKEMLEALELALGIVTTASERAGVARQSHYNWLKNDEEYKKAVHLIHERTLDFAESSLHKNIREGHVTATIFFLKTRGRERGYQENQSITFEEPPTDFSWFDE